MWLNCWFNNVLYHSKLLVNISIYNFWLPICASVSLMFILCPSWYAPWWYFQWRYLESSISTIVGFLLLSNPPCCKNSLAGLHCKALSPCWPILLLSHRRLLLGPISLLGITHFQKFAIWSVKTEQITCVNETVHAHQLITFAAWPTHLNPTFTLIKIT